MHSGDGVAMVVFEADGLRETQHDLDGPAVPIRHAPTNQASRHHPRARRQFSVVLPGAASIDAIACQAQPEAEIAICAPSRLRWGVQGDLLARAAGDRFDRQAPFVVNCRWRLSWTLRSPSPAPGARPMVIERWYAKSALSST
jgi:hypothetical protein